MLKITPKKPPRKRPPQSSAMVKVEGSDKNDNTSSSDVLENLSISAAVGEMLKIALRS